MKKKYLSIGLGLAVTMALISGCGSSAANNSTSSDSTSQTSSDTSGETDADSQTISGSITAIEGNTITVDDTQSFEVTDDTTITRDMGDMGGGQGGATSDQPGGQAPSGGNSDNAPGDSSDGGQTPPEMPSGQAPSDGSSDGSQGDSQTESPAKPDGDSSDGSQGDSQAEPPAKPDGDSSDGSQGDSSDGSTDDAQSDSSDGSQTPPDMPDGQAPSGESGQGGDFDPNAELTIDDLQVGDQIEVTLDEDGNAASIIIQGGQMSGDQPGGQSSGVDSYDAVTEYTEDTDVSDQSYESTGTDENAIHIYNGATVSLDGITVSRTSDNSTGGDNSSFYGVGAAILNTDGTTTISNADITTGADGGAGVFSYGDGVTYVNDSTITTSGNTSGGIHAAGGGTLYANRLTVETSGESSAAIRSDRGGGTMVVDGGSYTSNGKGSPAVYCTADIDISSADLTANGSEAVCIEGLNSLSLTDCNLTGNMPEDEQNDCTWNVILYQSMSGDSEVGNSSFDMTGGTLTAKNGGMFYTTNTESTFTLENVDITYADENDFFLKCTGNSNARGWGNAGSNGADCTFTAKEQEMEGDVIWDSISQLDLSLTEGSTLTGAVLDDESNAGDGGDGCCNLTIDQDSTWIVTGDSTLTTLTNAGTIQDREGNTVTIQGNDGTVYVQGSGSCTVTVNSYEG